MCKKRVFIQLDDGWYILNDINDTNTVLLDYHCVSIVRKNNVHVVYYDGEGVDDKVVDVRVFDKDGYLFADTISLSYEELKEASKRILEKDEEGTKMWRALNGFPEGPVTYVENKGDKTND
jgi:hypothetical protein